MRLDPNDIPEVLERKARAQYEAKVESWKARGIIRDGRVEHVELGEDKVMRIDIVIKKYPLADRITIDFVVPDDL